MEDVINGLIACAQAAESDAAWFIRQAAMFRKAAAAVSLLPTGWDVGIVGESGQFPPFPEKRTVTDETRHKCSTPERG